MRPEIMANGVQDNECFKVGSKIEVMTPGDRVVGEIVAYDYSNKCLATRSFHRNGDRKYMTLHLTNLDFAVDAKHLEANDSRSEKLPMLSPAKVQERLTSKIAQRKAKLSNSHISPEGQNLMSFVEKTFNDVKWDGDKLIVLDSVCVCPPYTADNVFELPNVKDSRQTADHIKKVVEKFTQAQERERMNQRSTSISPDNSTSSSSTS